jgi:hypothetical protein
MQIDASPGAFQLPEYFGESAGIILDAIADRMQRILALRTVVVDVVRRHFGDHSSRWAGPCLQDDLADAFEDEWQVEGQDHLQECLADWTTRMQVCCAQAIEVAVSFSC